MYWSILLGALLVFALRVADVSIGTIRTLLTVRGLKAASALIGFLEVLIFILAFTRVMRQVDGIWNVLAYSAGFATGTYVGMILEEQLALGFNVVSIVCKEEWAAIALALRHSGFGATHVVGEGKDGPVGIVHSIVRRKQVPAVLALCDELAPEAFITTEGTQQVYRGYIARAVK
jgi:uncharacterized protein YebE (UPF0316 family)